MKVKINNGGLPETRSQTMACTTRNTVNRLARKELYLNLVVLNQY